MPPNKRGRLANASDDDDEDEAGRRRRGPPTGTSSAQTDSDGRVGSGGGDDQHEVDATQPIPSHIAIGRLVQARESQRQTTTSLATVVAVDAAAGTARVRWLDHCSTSSPLAYLLINAPPDDDESGSEGESGEADEGSNNSEDVEEDKLSPYEQQRLEKIARNQARLASLGFAAVEPSTTEHSKPESKQESGSEYEPEEDSSGED
mmetsp:Transcript_10248/g.23429  ORF Transcript_10248/g.23429 Transcript_10248/m.23429 type:complete len:205 (+) Transcript_10248:124-738(+)